MKRAGQIALMFVLMLLASSLVTAQETPVAMPISEHEIVRVLAYGLDVFEPALWRMANAEDVATDVHVLWRHREQPDLLFFFMHQTYEGRLNAERIAGYYDDARFEALLVNYLPYEATAECERDGLMLYEFSSKQDGVTRILRYWVRQVGNQVVLSVNGVTPLAMLDTFEDYAARLFPDLPSCEGL